MTTQFQKEIGKILLTVGLAIAGATFAVVEQLGGVQARMDQLEKHTDDHHPPIDYRSLMDERERALRDRIESHERYFHQHRRD